MAEIRVTRAMLEDPTVDWFFLVAKAVVAELDKQDSDEHEISLKIEAAKLACRKPFFPGMDPALWRLKDETGAYIYWPASLCPGYSPSTS